MIRPQRHRPIPSSGTVVTQGQIGIHRCTISTTLTSIRTSVSQHKSDVRIHSVAGMTVTWEPGRPSDSEFLPAFESKFQRLKTHHMQKLADITQKSISEKS